MKIMNIKWDTGSMKLDLDIFFPASQPRINTFLKTITLDNNCDDLMQELKKYLPARLDQMKTELQEIGHRFWSDGGTSKAIKREFEFKKQKINHMESNVRYIKKVMKWDIEK